MNDEQLAALTDEDRKDLARALSALEKADGVEYRWQRRSPARAKTVVRVLTALADARLEVARDSMLMNEMNDAVLAAKAEIARLTEERDDARSAKYPKGASNA